MGDLFQPWRLIILAGLAILLFGGKKLPELGKGLGEGLRGFKEGMKCISDEPTAPGATLCTAAHARIELAASEFPFFGNDHPTVCGRDTRNIRTLNQ